MSEQVIIEIIKTIPAVLWPTLVLVLSLIFRKDIKNLFRRIKSGSVLGNNFELKDEVEALASKVTEIPTAKPEERKLEKMLIQRELDTNPVGELTLLSATIEKELRKTLYITGWFNNTRVGSVKSIVNSLVSNGALPMNQKSSVDLFMDIRNKIVHGTESVDVDSVRQVVDIGYALLNQIKNIQVERHFVEHTGVDIFSDPDCKNKISDGLGVILRTVSPGGKNITYQIFPSRVKYEKQGIEVTWEWSLEKIWGESYYVDPNSGEKKLAWKSSAEFVGRNAEDV
ncbi:hypothetical protein B0F87_103342 [Methylobacter tundripaludum]|uniref:Uncharacterized protein n=1 Tax=Methylobacter tundripaludum TaxID=173365 RepID=A0A2S6HGX4_9GAMM|nr:hypothetical protein [Methylobacter tundripaludum]PPK76735.1 hypothetical protein B0F87_103342 [Methylobacter tundripaludum]